MIIRGIPDEVEEDTLAAGSLGSDQPKSVAVAKEEQPKPKIEASTVV